MTRMAPSLITKHTHTILCTGLCVIVEVVGERRDRVQMGRQHITVAQRRDEAQMRCCKTRLNRGTFLLQKAAGKDEWDTVQGRRCPHESPFFR